MQQTITVRDANHSFIRVDQVMTYSDSQNCCQNSAVSPFSSQLFACIHNCIQSIHPTPKTCFAA